MLYLHDIRIINYKWFDWKKKGKRKEERKDYTNEKSIKYKIGKWSTLNLILLFNNYADNYDR